MGWISNITMRNKLLLLLFMPCLAFSFFAVNSLINNYNEIRSISHEDHLTEGVKLLTRLVININKEAELSLLSIVHKDGSAGKELQEERMLTDKALTEAKDYFSNLEVFARDKTLLQIWQRFLEQAEQLTAKRGQIDASSQYSSDSKAYFDNMINTLFTAIGTVAHSDEHIQVSSTINTSLNITQAIIGMQKELYILERAFKEDRFQKEQYEAFLYTIAQEDLSLAKFTRQATPEQLELMKNMLSGQAIKDTQKFRSLALEKSSTGKFGSDPQKWNEVQSAKIHQMTEFNNKLLNEADLVGNDVIVDAKENLTLIAISLFMVFAATFFLTAAIVRSITSPLKNLVVLAEMVSEGKLDSKLTASERGDELGGLERAIHKMMNNLQTLTRKLQEEVEVLASSTAEIVSSISEASSGTAETATAVTETTTTVEELKQTGQVSSEKAKDVLTSSEEALTILKNSEKSLGSTIQDMNQIQDRMTTISESIIKLSEHSQMIGKIIDTVNDLAEQSNLLAVNAAIEAAKAGDQGRGFGVVAQEVRSLAEQSKQAVVQVHTILNDIQNATSAAVMATEQGAKAVTKGVTQSSETNESIKVLSGGISKVTQSVSQISLSSEQQLIGVGQVTLAMTNIKEASNQHVQHMRQIETAVKDLNSVGQSLKGLVETYKL